MSEQINSEQVRKSTTNGKVFQTLCALGMPTLEAWNSICDAAERLKWDDDGRPYLTAKDGVRWFADVPGENDK